MSTDATTTAATVTANVSGVWSASYVPPAVAHSHTLRLSPSTTTVCEVVIVALYVPPVPSPAPGRTSSPKPPAMASPVPSALPHAASVSLKKRLPRALLGKRFVVTKFSVVATLATIVVSVRLTILAAS